MDFLATVFAGVLKRKLRNTRRSLRGDDLQTLHYSGNDFMLDPRVKPFCVFAEDDQVDVGVARGYVRKVLHRTEICEQFKPLAQLNVDAGESPADRRRDWALQPNSRALDRLVQFFWNVFTIALKRLGPGHVGFPLEFDAGCLENAHRSLGDL